MDSNDICSKLKDIIKRQTNLELQNDDILLDHGVDSLNIINIVIEIEICFNIAFNPEDLNYKNLQSITSISNYLNNLIE